MLAAVGITVGSGANFTASAANPGNAFTTGSLSIADSNAGAILTASGLRPGGTPVTGTVNIQNTGSLQGAFTLTSVLASQTGDFDSLLDELDLTVEDCGIWAPSQPSCTGSSSVYAGKLGAMPTKQLGTWAGGEKHTFKFTVSLPSTTGNSFQNKTAHADFTWNAAAN